MNCDRDSVEVNCDRDSGLGSKGPNAVSGHCTRTHKSCRAKNPSSVRSLLSIIFLLLCPYF